jgi:uncharacterized protein (TIGR03086 family)
MDDLGLLDLATDTFRSTLLEVGREQRYLPTPCGDWNVAGLVSHVLGGNHMAVRLLQGAPRAEATGYLAGLPLGDDPLATFDANAAAQIAAFSEPGALERMCDHPVGEVSGTTVLGFRVGDLTIHSWDLARAVGGPEDLPDALVERVWADFEPRRHDLRYAGVYGEGPSGDVPDSAPLQARLLDLVGRRP